MISKSVKDTETLAREFAGKIRPRAKRAAIVALEGNLGSGKTTFAKAFAGALGIEERDVTSPTFIIMKNYDLTEKTIGKNLFHTFIHIDAYRLEKAEEIERLGWQGIIADPGHLVLIEWPENIGDALPKDATRVSFTFIDENTREIVFN